MVALELEYLFEVGRTAEPAQTVLDNLAGTLALEICELPFASVLKRSLQEKWTRDPFDRIIISQAALRGASLISKDVEFHRRYERTIW